MLTNLKMLVLVDLKLLLANVQWRKMDRTRSGTSVVLDAARAGADGSRLETSKPVPVNQECAAAQEGVATAAPAEGTAECNKVAPNLWDFTTWTPDSWDAVPFSDLSFPVDKPMIQNKCYIAVAILFTDKVALRAQHADLWTGLRAAWESQFDVELKEKTLGKPPTAVYSGGGGMVRETVRFLTQGGRQLRRETRRPAATTCVDKPPTQKKRGRDVGGER